MKNKPIRLKNSFLLIISAVLVILSFVIDHFPGRNDSITRIQQTIQQHIQGQEMDFEKLLNDPVVKRQMDLNSFDDNLLLQLTSKPYFIYRYFINDVGVRQLLFWSTQTVIPSDSVIRAKGKSGFIKLPNGYYVWNKKNTSNNITIALIPVKWNYFVTNNYLQNTFTAGKNFEDKVDIAAVKTNTPVKSITGSPLFYINSNENFSTIENSRIVVWLRIFTVLLLLLFIHRRASSIAKNNSLTQSLLFLIPVVLLLRIISYYFPIPLNLRQFELFNPAIYGSSVVLRSLGDLFINSLLFTWIILFIHRQLHADNFKIDIQKQFHKWVLLIGIGIAFITATFISAHIIRSMVADSLISFDVINFFSLNMYSLTGFIILCNLVIAYFFMCQILLFLAKPLYSAANWWLYLTVTTIGLLYLTLQSNIAQASFNLCVLGWLLLFLQLLNRDHSLWTVEKISSIKLIFWLFFFSLSVTAIIVLENNSKELDKRKHYAEALSTKADPSQKTLLNSFLTDFRVDYLAANFYRFLNESSNQFFKDSLVSGNFSGYTNKYDTRIFTFDAGEKPLFNKDNVGFNDLNTVLKTQARPTNIPELFYFDESFDRYSYISRKTVINPDGDTLGFVFVLAKPKNYKTDALNIELFSRGDHYAIENSSTYAFAVYNNLHLVNSHNNYPFPTELSGEQLSKEEFTVIRKKHFNELWYKASPQIMVVIAKPNNWFIESITLFSYLFCCFLLITGLLWMLNVILRSGFKYKRISHYWHLSIRNQIHGTVIFISVLSFIIIGIATILFFINRYQGTNREKLSRIIQVIETEIRRSLSDLSLSGYAINAADTGFTEKLQPVLEKISEIHAVDINLYALDGSLLVSTLPLPYSKGIVSNRMNPIAYNHLNQRKDVQFFKDEQIGKLNFVSNYVPVRDAAGRKYAYLNIPYFTSERKLQEEIASFLVTIINLNAFIFLIAGIIALFITNQITKSFSFISEKMKAINLGQKNEAIEWKRDDEIGDLVKEYNKMVNKLEASAVAMAKTEREDAWREMARQVAHEIKNPLTPMKLSLQYLQKSIANQSDNVELLTARVAETLVEQIEHLNHIAGEFSQFANIGNPKNEIFNLNEVINLVTQLHAVDDRIHIDVQVSETPVMVFADRTQVNRLFTNLILNAIQAIPIDRKAEIQITEAVKDKSVLIKIVDNGIGIDEALHSKIFTPNFTTKTSGTGLGLAMCKGIVEQAGGSIWFETTMEKGTTFFIELPTAH